MSPAYVWPSLLLMIVVIYSVRMLPMVLLQRNITNRFIRSFLYYVPYVTLSVMTFPAIIKATDDIRCGFAALGVGLVTAWFFKDLFIVALSCCGAVLLTGLIF